MGLLLTAFCAASGLYAQVPAENLERYYTFDRLRSKSGWLNGDNPAGLIENQVSFSTADLSYDYTKGGLRNVNDGAKSHAMGIGSESYQRWKKLSFYGKLGFNYISALDRSWAGNTGLYSTSMPVGDSIPGNTRNEVYSVKAGVAYQMGQWVLGAMVEYENQSLAKRRDLRNKTTAMNMAVRPGVMFRSKIVDAGLNFTYKRMTETVGYATFGTSTQKDLYNLFEGLWFYSTQAASTNPNDYITYKGSNYGGGAQVELKAGERFKFFNQFTAEYGQTERYVISQDERMGDDESLSYRYLGIVNLSGEAVDQRLSVDATWGDLFKYNNIQELVQLPGSTTQAYKQYGKILKFQQTQRRVEADYKLYVKRNAWSSSWIVDLRYSYFKNESQYTIYPVRYLQDLHYSRATAAVTKNFLFGERNWLDVTLCGGYHFGGGEMLDKVIPEGVQLENENYRADLLAQEFHYFTNDRFIGEFGVRYTHYMPAKKIGLYIDLRGHAERGRKGVNDGLKRGNLLATVGLNF